MGRPKDSTRRDAIIREYERHLSIYGYAKYDEITKAVGLFANHSSYVRRVIQLYREQKENKGQMRECLCCDDHFISTGKHHRLCDKCRFNGEYMAPYPISSSILRVGREW
jgi:NAD kinase